MALISGNPGLLNYYLPFLNHLHGLLPPTHAIISTSHVGHSPNLPAPAQPVDLFGHLDAKVELASALRQSLDAWSDGTKGDAGGQFTSSRPKLVIMGHSVGGWLMVEVIKRMNRHERLVHAGYVLFPSLGYLAESRNGRTLWVSQSAILATA
jgi:hypothetical protein